MLQFDANIDYYEVLQVHPSAHQEVIKRAYRTILGMLQAHPDLGGSHEDAVRVNEAYQVLSNPELRQAYDAARRSAMVNKARATTADAPATSPRPSSRTVTSNRLHSNHTAGTSNGNGVLRKRVRRHIPQIVFCPCCGTRNRLPAAANLHHAICGKCRNSLEGGRTAGQMSTFAAANLQLTPDLREQLIARSELRLQRAQMPSDGRLLCHLCHHEWQEQPGVTVPTACPRCHSQQWNNFRLFRCRFCSHQFSSGDINSWAYWLFPECPSCHQPGWHTGCEASPFRWVLDKFVNLLNLLGL
ncbi:MAG: J domain-containing protein [Armatimonadota bacterium]